MYRSLFLLTAWVSMAMGPAGPVMAQTAWPAKPIRVVVPFTPAGAVDTVARAVADRLSERLGQSLVIENKPGAGGMIGSAEIARAAPDGYSWLMVFDTHAVNHLIYPDMTFDTFKDLAPVSLMATSPMTLAAANALNVKTLPELIAQAKAAPKGLSCGHVGPGSSNQLTMIQLEQRAGFKCNEVAYRGAAPMLNDLIGGHLDMAFIALPVVMNQIAAKTVTGVAVAARSSVAQLPGVPTVASTYPDFVALSWVGLLLPAKTPEAIISRVNAEVVATLQEPAVKDRLTGLGYFIEASSPSSFGTFIRGESDRWAPLIKSEGIAIR